MPDFNACGPFVDFQAKRMLDQDSVEFRPVRSETRSFWEEETLQKSLPKPASSDGQELVVILRVRTVPTQGARKSVVFGGGNPVGVFLLGQFCVAGDNCVTQARAAC